MSWVKDEEIKIKERLNQQQSDEFLITYSNYWSSLINQIQSDIQEINNSEAWQKALREPIKIEENDGGYKIKKTSFPSAFYIIIKNGGRTISVETQYKKSGVHDWESNEETLNVELENHQIVLKRGRDAFLVPEQAAKYILQTIVKAENDSLEVFTNRHS